ncbi:MAG: DUF721 domain-containing protein [Desulfatibacillum sp.]|nr:DUF721 domain-containing protein [Desulfatibacillum sp.]
MAEKRKVKKIPEELSAILERILGATDKQLNPEIDRIFSLWDQSVGPEIAANAQPDSFKNGMLMVKVSSAPWSQQLEYEKSLIIDRINVAVGKRLVTEIRFKTGSIRKKAPRKKPLKKV